MSRAPDRAFGDNGAMRFGYLLLYVPDVLAAADFYEKAFGLPRRLVHEDGYVEMDTGTTVLGFVAERIARENGVELAGGGDQAPAPPFEIALVTERLDADYERALAGGAGAVKPPEAKPWGQSVAYVRDLNGFLVELCTPVQGA